MTLVLCLPDGEVLGSLPPFEVEVPWWQEVGPVVMKGLTEPIRLFRARREAQKLAGSSRATLL